MPNPALTVYLIGIPSDCLLKAEKTKLVWLQNKTLHNTVITVDASGGDQKNGKCVPVLPISGPVQCHQKNRGAHLSLLPQAPITVIGLTVQFFLSLYVLYLYSHPGTYSSNTYQGL